MVELVKAGIDLDIVRAYLDRHAPQVRDRFEAAVAMAREEE